MKIRNNEIEWHDAQIIELNLKTVADSFDLNLTLDSDSYVKEYGQNIINITIKDCYKVRCDLNLWIKGADSIFNVYIRNDSEWINEEKKKIANNFGPSNLFHFEIITNTNSKIEVLITSQDCFELIM